MVEPEDFVAGALSLDFVNTVGGIRSGLHSDKLQTYDDLVGWGVLGNAISEAQGNLLKTFSRRRPDLSTKALSEAKALREALHGVFYAAIKKQTPPKQAFEFVNQRLGVALAHARIRRRAEKYEWTWDAPEMLEAPLWPVVHDAAELLASASLERLQECASATCGWLFLDLTKNHSRRWCAMSNCGNRAKVRRFRDRHA